MITVSTQFRSLGKRIAEITEQHDEGGLVPADMLHPLIACCIAQAEMAEQGLMEPERAK